MSIITVRRPLRKIVIGLLLFLTSFLLSYWANQPRSFSNEDFSTPPSPSDPLETYALLKFPELKYWKRPGGPLKVGIQVGHWKVADHPDELAHLRENTGAEAGGYTEWEVNYKIATLLAAELNKQGIETEILPATLPKAYWADLLVSIHADGDLDTSKSGFKASTSWVDYTKKAQELVDLIKEQYGNDTGLAWDDNISRNMLGYYAFNWWRHEHAIHPMTPAIIMETGFLTNPEDRRLLTQNPEIVSSSLSKSIVEFLN